LLNGNGIFVGLIGSSLTEDTGSSGGGGDGDAGVTGNGDTSRRIVFLIGSENVGRVGDGA
jgi:hypothetical protein